MQITINPADELPSTLRAVALMLNSIASDRDSRTASVIAPLKTAGESVTQIPPLADNPGNAHAVPGASGQSQIPPPPPLTGVVAQTDNAGSSTELDANGLPWDERIHSSSKNKNQDQTWRYIRIAKAEDKPAFEELKKNVEAELRARVSGGQQATQPTSADAPPPPPPLNTAPVDQTPPPPPPPLAEPQADAPGATQVTMQEVFSRAYKMPVEQRNMALEAVGLASMTEFLKEYKVRPELAGELNAALSAVSGEE